MTRTGHRCQGSRGGPAYQGGGEDEGALPKEVLADRLAGEGKQLSFCHFTPWCSFVAATVALVGGGMTGVIRRMSDAARYVACSGLVSHVLFVSLAYRFCCG